MWVRTGQLQQIDSALEAGRAADIDGLIADILRSGASELSTSNACAVCRRELVRSELQGGVVVFACPGEHGAWLSPDTLAELRRLGRGHATSAPRPSRIKMLSALLAASLATLAVSVSLGVTPLVPHLSSARLMPMEERRYLQELLTVLGDGTKHRRDVEGVLHSKSESATYGVVYQIYRERQGDVLARLKGLDVPAPLRPVHDRIIVATERQIEFYGAFTEARMRDDSVNLARMLAHPALRSSDYELHAAWDLIRGIYPDLDRATSQTIEGALCQFDVI